MSLEPDPELVKVVMEHQAKNAIRRAIPSKCEECSTEWPSKTALDKHIREVHPKEPVFNDELREKYLDLLRVGGFPTKSARKLGISPETVKRAMRIDPTFAEAVEIAEEEGSEEIEEVFRESAKSGQPWAVTGWLKKRSARRWSDEKNINVNISGDIRHYAGLLPHEQAIMSLKETVQERARISGRTAELDNPEIIDAEVIE